LPKNILANFNINIIVSKSKPIFFIIIEDKTNINDLRIFNIKKFFYIQKYLYFQDIIVYNYKYNYNFDFIRNILSIKQQKGMIINYNDIKKIKLKMERYINKVIYECLYFNYKIGDNLLKIKKFDSFNTEKNIDENKIISLLENKNGKKDDDIKNETNNEMKNFILDKNLIKQFPPKIPSLYEKKYKFKNDKISNVFYNHLLVISDAIKKKKRLVKYLLTRRIKGKSLTILFFSPLSKY
jgi:hypothetical protein